MRHLRGGASWSPLSTACRRLAGADTSSHGRVRFVIALKSNDSAMRFRLLKAIQAGLYLHEHAVTLRLLLPSRLLHS